MTCTFYLLFHFLFLLLENLTGFPYYTVDIETFKYSRFLYAALCTDNDSRDK